MDAINHVNLVVRMYRTIPIFLVRFAFQRLCVVASVRPLPTPRAHTHVQEILRMLSSPHLKG